MTDGPRSAAPARTLLVRKDGLDPPGRIARSTSRPPAAGTLDSSCPAEYRKLSPGSLHGGQPRAFRPARVPVPRLLESRQGRRTALRAPRDGGHECRPIVFSPQGCGKPRGVQPLRSSRAVRPASGPRKDLRGARNVPTDAPTLPASPTPVFTKRIAPGIAIAEEPRTGDSFGQSRCEILADALIRSEDEASTSDISASVRRSRAGASPSTARF